MEEYELKVLNNDNAIVVKGNDTFNANILNSFITFLDVAPKTAEIYKRAIKQFFTYLKVNNADTQRHCELQKVFRGKGTQTCNNSPVSRLYT